MRPVAPALVSAFVTAAPLAAAGPCDMPGERCDRNPFDSACWRPPSQLPWCLPVLHCVA